MSIEVITFKSYLSEICRFVVTLDKTKSFIITFHLFLLVE